MGARTVIPAALALVAVAIGVVLLKSGNGERVVRASFDQANNLVPGLEVRVAGVVVGKVGDVELENGRASVTIEIQDERAWPLPADTRAALRFGTTVGDAVRFVQLIPGKGDEHLEEGGVIAAANATSPVEFDELFDAFDRRTRRSFRGALRGLDRNLGGRSRELREAVSRGGRGMLSMTALLRDLEADTAALGRFLDAGSRAMRAMTARDGAIEEVVSGGRATFAAFAQRERELGAAIERAPAALREADATLAEAAGTADRLGLLLDDLAPAAKRLPELGRRTARVLARLEETAGPLGTALADTAAAAPDVRRLLRTGTRVAGPMTKAVRGLVPPLRCIRPYTPEIVGFISTWNGMAMNYDGLDHFARVHAIASATSLNGNPLTPGEYVSLIPGLHSALPRPPGLAAGQPWLLPECGAGPEALDPNLDPETIKP